jgi:hypothetical protein
MFHDEHTLFLITDVFLKSSKRTTYLSYGQNDAIKNEPHTAKGNVAIW